MESSPAAPAMAAWLLILLSPLILYLLSRSRRRKNPAGSDVVDNLPPGPPRLPVIGNLHQLRHPIHRRLSELAHEHGPIVHLRLGSVDALVVSSPELAREVMKTQDATFCSRPQLTVLKKFAYGFLDVVSAPYGDHWRQLRKLYAAELFSPQKVLSFRPVREEEVARMVLSVRTQIQRQSQDFTKEETTAAVDLPSSATALINVSKLMEGVINGIICRVAFGMKGGAGGGGKLHRALMDFLGLCVEVFAEDYFPGVVVRAVDAARGLHRRVDASFAGLDGFYGGVIDEHLRRMAEEGEGWMEQDFTDVLLRLVKEKPGELNLDYVKAAMGDILVAGTDTSSAVLTWAMAELMNNPKAMEEARHEVRSAAAGPTVTEEDIHQLRYLKAVVNETLRLHPPAPLLIPRETMSRCRVGGYDIPAGTRVFVNAWEIGRDPRWWPNPDEFSPERFMTADDGGEGGGAAVDYKGQCFQFVPFGSGRRICPGMQLGACMVELVLANLLYCFDWELPEGMEKVDMDEAEGIIVHKKDPLILKATYWRELPPVAPAEWSL